MAPNRIHPDVPTVALINDTSITSPHFGCQLVGQTFREQFKRTGIQQVGLPKRFDTDQYRKIFDAVDLIVINGEGTLHHNKYRHLLDLASQYPTVMVNCVYQANDPNPGLKKLLYCSARESNSAAEIRKEGIQCDVVPDVIFTATYPRIYPRAAPQYALGITDNVVKEYHGVWPLRWRVKDSRRCHDPRRVYREAFIVSARSCRSPCRRPLLHPVSPLLPGIQTPGNARTHGGHGHPHLHFDNRREAIANVPITCLTVSANS